MPRAVPRKASVKANSKCACNPGWLIVAAILGTLGIYALVAGFRGQFNGIYDAGSVLLMYFVGILLVTAAKISKIKCNSVCTIHR